MTYKVGDARRKIGIYLPREINLGVARALRRKTGLERAADIGSKGGNKSVCFTTIFTSAR